MLVFLSALCQLIDAADASQVPVSRFTLQCDLCKQPHGAAVQCSAGSRCCTAFHPLCARLAGLPMQQVDAANQQKLAELKQRVRSVVGDGARGWSLEREGTALAGGIHLVAFCGKHRACASGAAPTAALQPAPAAAPNDASLERLHGRYVPVGFARGPEPTCARLLRAVSCTRRGMKQPDIVTVAQVKRTYVQVRSAVLSVTQ
jgi:PHD-zinc-finger like domain